jgi:hypothetical protein
VIPGLGFHLGRRRTDTRRDPSLEGTGAACGSGRSDKSVRRNRSPTILPSSRTWLWRTADLPVGIHLGTGPPGATYVGFDKYLARLQSALLLEEPLLRHPRLRVYVTHAGWPMIDDLLALLWAHPHV